jgi:hypothetical protein
MMAMGSTSMCVVLSSSSELIGDASTLSNG